MAAEELTPEEKLLKVIQGGGKPVDAAVSADTSTAAGAPAASAAKTRPGIARPAAAPVSKPTAGRSAIRPGPRPAVAAKPAPAPAAPGKTDAGVTVEAPQPVAAPAPKPAPAPRAAGKRAAAAARAGGARLVLVESRPAWQATHGGPRPLTWLNRGLAAGIALVVGLLAFEIYAAIGTGRSAPAQYEPWEWSRPSAHSEMPALEDLLALATGRTLIGDPVVVGPQPQPGPQPPPPPSAPWKEYAEANMKLSGLSALPDGRMEAILKDRQAGRNYFCAVGQPVMAGSVEVQVAEIGQDNIVLSDGRINVVIK